MYFNRFDICEAHCVLEWHWSSGGWLQDRPSNQRRMEATHIQLDRIGFSPALSLEYDSLTENGKAIYDALELRYYGFTTNPELDTTPSERKM